MMIPLSQSLTSHTFSPILPTSLSPKLPSLSLSPKRTHLHIYPHRRTSQFRPLICSVSVASEPKSSQSPTYHKPFPAEVSRTVMELSSVGTLSTLTRDGWPIGIGVRFAVDAEGTPVLSLNSSNRQFSIDTRSTLHVQLNQSGLRTPQCTIQGSLDKPEDGMTLKKLQSVWEKRFGEEADEDLLYVVAVHRVLQLEDFMEEGMWVTSSSYKAACPDPLRDFAERIVGEINLNNKEDVHRFCNIYADLDFQATEAKIVWVDRLGFDMRVHSPENEMFEIRIPFPREVTDEKGVKSSFNGMSQVAWEVEKNYCSPDFKKVKQLKKIRCRAQ